MPTGGRRPETAGNLRSDETFAIDAIAKKFFGTWRPGENPPDAYLLIGQVQEIAVEISTLTQHVTDDKGTRPRATDDKAAVLLIDELKMELSGLVPDGEVLGLLLSAPVLKRRKTKAALANVLHENLAKPRLWNTELTIEINGNIITVFRDQYDGASKDKIYGVISNRHSNTDLLSNARQILEDRIAVKAKKCAGLVGKRALWLGLLNDYWLTGAHEYNYALSLFSSEHPFEKVLLADPDGAVEELAA